LEGTLIWRSTAMIPFQSWKKSASFSASYHCPRTLFSTLKDVACRFTKARLDHTPGTALSGDCILTEPCEEDNAMFPIRVIRTTADQTDPKPILGFVAGTPLLTPD